MLAAHFTDFILVKVIKVIKKITKPFPILYFEWLSKYHSISEPLETNDLYFNFSF